MLTLVFCDMVPYSGMKCVHKYTRLHVIILHITVWIFAAV